MHTIHLKAVDSREATDDELDAAGITSDQIPPGWKIMAHQAATVRALRSGTAPIIINAAMTGDGKSLVGQFRLFADSIPTITMYPTNELARDQKRSLDSMLEKWTPPRWTRSRLNIGVVSAVELDDWQTHLDALSRSETLRIALDNDLVLTNPDIVHLMMQFGYVRYGAARDLLLTDVTKRFPLFVFDEFHLFGAPQTASALIAILLALKISSAKHPSRFLFLSATPQKLLGHLARLVDVEVETIQGEYQSGLATPSDGYRRILQPVDLHLHSGKLEAWVAENLETIILPFFSRNRPGARGVIIASSVATAYRVLELLKEPCRKANITLGINTGLTPRDERTIDVDLLVATSTIDVGVDFRVNLLIFESIDAASHIQRLGRLGRHQDDGKGHSFEQFEAHGLLLPWVVEAVAGKIAADAIVDRGFYKDTLDLPEVYPPLQHFETYLKRWAGVQAAHVLAQLGKTEIKKQYESIWRPLSEEYKKLFPSGTPRYIGLIKDEQLEILNEAKSFRGGSPFTALVVDMMNESRSVQSYNLLALLLNGDLESVRLADLYDQAWQQGKNVEALKRNEPLAGYRLRGWLPAPRPLDIYVDRELDVTRFDIVIEQKGFRLNAPGVPEMMALNERLEERTLVALLVRNDDPDMIRRRLRIGFQLDLLKFQSADGSNGCAAFARDALLLDSILFRSRQSNDNRPLIV